MDSGHRESASPTALMRSRDQQYNAFVTTTCQAFVIRETARLVSKYGIAKKGHDRLLIPDIVALTEEALFMILPHMRV